MFYFLGGMKMNVKCPNCGKIHSIEKNSPRINQSVVGEYFVVCNELIPVYRRKNLPLPYGQHFPSHKKCDGYIVIDMEKLGDIEK